MPHRVTSFLRNPSAHTSSKRTHTTDMDSRTPRPMLQRRQRHANSSSNTCSDASDEESGRESPSNSSNSSSGSNSPNHHHRRIPHMPDLADAVLKSHRRISLPFHVHVGKRDSTNQSHPVSLGWAIESPPVIFHGTAQDSTGAILSGQMALDVREESVDVESFEATLKIHVYHKRPFQNHCHDCQNQYTELKTWKFITQPLSLRQDKHYFPFSMLMDGHLPATMDSPVMSVSYEFTAEAILAGGQHAPLPKFERTIEVKRSVPEPEVPHHSVRLFPPTNIKSSAHYCNVIHPTGTNKVTVKLDGLMSRNENSKTLDMWKLKKFTWKLQETVKTIAPACEKHAPAAEAAAVAAAIANPASVAADPEAAAAARKGAVRAESRILGEKQLHDGWKSDYSGSDGTVDLEFDYLVNRGSSSGRKGGGPKFACDMKSGDGTEVSHTLLIELVVSREFAPDGKPHLSTQTGAGRILRMHYNVIMTEHSGLGLSWDQESPPVYQDVPSGPPAYPVLCESQPSSPLQTPLEQPIEYEELLTLDARRASESDVAVP